MSRYIKKHRRQFMGVALPLFFLFVLGSIGLSVFPGWINSTYGLPGDPCSGPFDTVCDTCNGESCVLNDTLSIPTSQCANIITSGFSVTTNFDPSITAPACPLVSSFQQQQPGCWTNCAETLTVSVATTIEVPVCSPNNNFCEGISGGDQANACRTASCTTDSTFDTLHPSGCIYDFDSSAVSNAPPACILCSSPQPAGFTACGDGICEAGLGENCTSCPIDCLVPGFDDVCPVTDAVILDDACSNVPAIVFSGPPFNVSNSHTCEDGEVCTRSSCNGGPTCSNPPAPCDDITADFCCPSGCNAPVSGSCSGVSNCDIDCLPPVECPFCGNNIIDAGEQCDGTAANNCGVAGCDNATCQCNPPVPGLLEGDGVGITTCSLHPQQTLHQYQGAEAFIGLALALAGFVMLRRRAN
jgi:hypothetical protein